MGSFSNIVLGSLFEQLTVAKLSGFGKMTPIFWNRAMQYFLNKCNACGYCKLIPQKYQFVSFFNVKLCEFAWNARFDICGPYVRRSNAWISNRHFISFHHADNLHYNELQIHPLTKFYPALLFQSSKCIFCALRSSCRSQHLWPPQVKNLICWGIRYIPQIWLVSVFLLLKVLLSHNRLWAQLQSQWAMVSLLETKIIWVCWDFGKKLKLKDVCSP